MRDVIAERDLGHPEFWPQCDLVTIKGNEDEISDDPRQWEHIAVFSIFPWPERYVFHFISGNGSNLQYLSGRLLEAQPYGGRIGRFGCRRGPADAQIFVTYDRAVRQLPPPKHSLKFLHNVSFTHPRYSGLPVM